MKQLWFELLNFEVQLFANVNIVDFEIFSTLLIVSVEYWTSDAKRHGCVFSWLSHIH